MNYRYVKNSSDDLYSVHESKTGHTVKENMIRDQARELVRKLNFGGGFNGWTPQFFTNKIYQTGE